MKVTVIARSLTGKFIFLSGSFVCLLGLFIYAGFRFTHHIYDEATRINLAGQTAFVPLRLPGFQTGLLKRLKNSALKIGDFSRLNLNQR